MLCFCKQNSKLEKNREMATVKPYFTVNHCILTNFLTKIDLFQELNQDEVFQDFAAQGQPGQDYSLDMSSASGQIY